MAARTYRATHGPAMFKALFQEFMNLNARLNYSPSVSPAIGNGTTLGRLRTTVAATGRLAGINLSVASIDNLWDLSAQASLSAGQFKAFWLYVDGASAGSIAAGTVQTTAALALANLPALDDTKAVWGAYVAGPSTNFAAALAAQGTIHNGLPTGGTMDGTGRPESLILPVGLVNLLKA
ncbi:MAG: hypothetical protein ABL912_01825 [Novosphingobium sp.]